MARSEKIRRRPDGSIDIDFYHAGAIALRRQAMREAVGPRAVLRLMLAKVAVVLVFWLVVALHPQDHDAIETWANKGATTQPSPMHPLRERAEQLRRQLVNAAAARAVQ
jgi:hypothetical protein